MATKAKHSQYLGDIHYHDKDGNDVSCRGAVWCMSRQEFDAKVGDYLKARGESFLWSEEVHEALGWFNKFGSHGLMAGLSKRVDKDNPVALSDPKAAFDEAQDSDDGYLIIEEIEGVEPLDMQLGVYPKLTVPEALQEAMFGQPEPTEAEIEAARQAHEENDDPDKQEEFEVPPMGTYAILDAAKMPYLLTGELEHSSLQYQSLFQGDAQEELGEYAPYIVKLEDGNDFTRKLFTDLKPPLGLWEKELGIFIRSRADLPTLRKHFRKFTKVQDENGKWYYFRFWEGRVMSNLFTSELKIEVFHKLFDMYEPIKLVSQYEDTYRIIYHNVNYRKQLQGTIATDKFFDLIHDANKKSQFERVILSSIRAIKKHKTYEEFNDSEQFSSLMRSCQKYYEMGFRKKSELSALCVIELWYGHDFKNHPKKDKINTILESSLDSAERIQMIKTLLSPTN